VWKFVLLELYCGIYGEYHQKSGKYCYELSPGHEDPDDLKRVENPEYDPEFPKPTPPEYCKKMVGVDCMKNNCIHVAYCEGSQESGDKEIPE
jgi:hypothetical protein